MNSNSLFFKENEKEQASLLFLVAKRGGGSLFDQLFQYSCIFISASVVESWYFSMMKDFALS